MPQRAPGSREEDAWLSDEQLTKCTPADEAEGFDSPIPTHDGVERRVHAVPADRQAEAGGGADQGAGRLRFEEARNQPTEVSGRNGGNGRRPPGDERGVRPGLRPEADRPVSGRGLRGERAAA